MISAVTAPHQGRSRSRWGRHPHSTHGHPRSGNYPGNGGYGQPFYTKHQQGKGVVTRRVQCTEAGVTFGQSFNGLSSIILRHTGANIAYLCPASAATCDATDDELVANSMYLKTDDALILDRATQIGDAGWKCFTVTGTS